MVNAIIGGTLQQLNVVPGPGGVWYATPAAAPETHPVGVGAPLGHPVGQLVAPSGIELQQDYRQAVPAQSSFQTQAIVPNIQVQGLQQLQPPQQQQQQQQQQLQLVKQEPDGGVKDEEG